MDRPTINYRMQMGVSSIAHGCWDLMTTEERIQYEKEVGMTSGQNYDFLSKTDVNWMDVVFNDKAMLQSHEVAVSGATDKTNYYFSGVWPGIGIALTPLGRTSVMPKVFALSP